MGSKLGLLLNWLGLIVGWGWVQANAHGTLFHPLIQAVEERMLVLADTGFHAAEGEPSNLKRYRRGGVEYPPAGRDGAVDAD